jgi:hypothetical protein
MQILMDLLIVNKVLRNCIAISGTPKIVKQFLSVFHTLLTPKKRNFSHIAKKLVQVLLDQWALVEHARMVVFRRT